MVAGELEIFESLNGDSMQIIQENTAVSNAALSNPSVVLRRAERLISHAARDPESVYLRHSQKFLSALKRADDEIFRNVVAALAKANSDISGTEIILSVEQFIETEKQSETTLNLKPVIASSLKEKPVYPREWLVENWVSLGVVTGLGGPPGAAKSTFAQQLCTHVAAGQPLLGEKVMQVPALYLTVEDDADELHRRQLSFCKAMHLDISEFNELHLMSWVGDESLLVYQENGIFHRTKRFNELSEYIGDYAIQCVVLDLIPDFWNGNEIVRQHVNGFVKGHLAYLASAHNAAVIPIYHPSRSGMADGSGTSGSTAWEGSFRGRIYISRPEKSEPECNDRIISRMKSNYSALGETEVTWDQGYLWPKGATETKEDEYRKYRVSAFTECLQWCNEHNMEVSPSANSNHYYGKSFPGIWKNLDKRHKPLTRQAFEKAYFDCRFDEVIKETENTKTKRQRIIFSPNYDFSTPKKGDSKNVM